MPNILDILARAQSLMNETALNSITPPRAGGIMYDTLLVLNQMQLEGASLLISKVYASVSAMEADTTPTSDLTGRALKPGQLVVIVTSDTSSSDMGSEYRYNGPGSWTYVGKVGGLPLDTVPTQNSTKGITSGAVYDVKQALEGEVSQLGLKVDEDTHDVGCTTKGLIKCRPGYITGTAGNPPTLNADNTKHCSYWIPVKPYQKVRLVGATGATIVYVNSAGNFISNISVSSVVPPGAAMASIQFNDSANAQGYENVYAYYGDSNEEALTYKSRDFNCFYRDASYSQINFDTQNALRAFVTLKLTGFDSTKKHAVRYISRNTTGNKYRLILIENNNGTITDVFDVTATSQEAVANACNHYHQEKNGKIVDAWIDWNFITDGGYISVGTSNPFYVKPECYDEITPLASRVTAIENSDPITETDLTIEAVSDNLANPDDIVDGKYVNSSGGFNTNADWAMIGIPVTPGDTLTFGGFYLGRAGYYAFYNVTTLVESHYMADPNGTQSPVTVTIPDGTTLLYFNIKTDSSPENPYQYLMINKGVTLKPYEEYETAVTEIGGIPVAGGASVNVETRLSALEDDVEDINETLSDGIANIIADLPVSADGSGIATGYAYINSSTGAVIVKQ